MKKGRNIYKRKDGRYEARYIKFRDDNNIKYGYIYAKSYTEVRAKLLNVNNLVAQPDDTEIIPLERYISNNFSGFFLIYGYELMSYFTKVS